jgi:hypothetical protein
VEQGRPALLASAVNTANLGAAADPSLTELRTSNTALVASAQAEWNISATNDTSPDVVPANKRAKSFELLLKHQ